MGGTYPRSVQMLGHLSRLATLFDNPEVRVLLDYVFVVVSDVFGCHSEAVRL